MKRLLLSLVVLTCLASIAQAKGPYRYRPYFYSGNSNYSRGQSMLDYDLLSHGGYGPGAGRLRHIRQSGILGKWQPIAVLTSSAGGVVA